MTGSSSSHCPRGPPPQILWITLWMSLYMPRYGLVPGAMSRNAYQILLISVEK